MLRETFRTEPLQYSKNRQGLYQNNGTPPYGESLSSVDGLFVTGPTEASSLTSRIHLMTLNNTVAWPSWGHAYYVWDGLTGKFLQRVGNQQSSLGAIFAMGRSTMSRKGVPYGLHYYGTSWNKLSFGPSSLVLPGEDPKTAAGWTVAQWDAITPNAVTGAYKVGGPGSTTMSPLFGFGASAIDDMRGIFIDANFENFRTFEFPSGKFGYEMVLPGLTVTLALASNSQCYILLHNQQVVLIDYMRGEVLGCAKVPSLDPKGDYGGRYWNNSYMVMAWDPFFKRLLVCQKVPENPDGSSAVVVRGFSLVNDPCRITYPIPLKVPRFGRQIPVLVQVVDEMNRGVGGYTVDAKVY